MTTGRLVCILGLQLVAVVSAASGVAQTSGTDSMEVRLRRELSSGHVHLPPLQFAKQGGRVDLASAEILKRVARAMISMDGGFIIEAHVKPTSNATADQTEADRRASIVRSALMELGVPATRLFAVGIGRERRSPSERTKIAAPAADAERVDIARLR